MASNDSDNDIFVQEEVVGDVPINDGSSEKKRQKGAIRWWCAKSSLGALSGKLSISRIPIYQLPISTKKN